MGVLQTEYCVKIHLPGDKDQVSQPDKDENTAKLYFHHFVEAFKNNCHTKRSLDNTVAIVADLAKCVIFSHCNKRPKCLQNKNSKF